MRHCDRAPLIQTVVSHFQTGMLSLICDNPCRLKFQMLAKLLVDSALAQKAMQLIMKDVSWLWRTAYNCAIQGCTEWDGHDEQVLTLFDIARDVRRLHLLTSVLTDCV